MGCVLLNILRKYLRKSTSTGMFCGWCNKLWGGRCSFLHLILWQFSSSCCYFCYYPEVGYFSDSVVSPCYKENWLACTKHIHLCSIPSAFHIWHVRELAIINRWCKLECHGVTLNFLQWQVIFLINPGVKKTQR